MHFICMCDRTLQLLGPLSFTKPTLFCSSGSSLCSNMPRRLIFFFLFPPFGGQMMTKACNRLKRRDSI